MITHINEPKGTETAQGPPLCPLAAEDDGPVCRPRYSVARSQSSEHVGAWIAATPTAALHMCCVEVPSACLFLFLFVAAACKRVFTGCASVGVLPGGT